MVQSFDGKNRLKSQNNKFESGNYRLCRGHYGIYDNERRSSSKEGS